MNQAAPFFRRLAVVAFASAVLPLAALAQTHRGSSLPRLPADAAQTSRIPAGVDSGTSTTSSSTPLGMPVPPDPSADRVEQRTRSAAARAAARPDPLSRTGAPLKPAAPLVGPAVIRDASRSTDATPKGRATNRLACADRDEVAFRRSMSTCTSMPDRTARSACVDGVMQARRASSAEPVTLPQGGCV